MDSRVMYTNYVVSVMGMSLESVTRVDFEQKGIEDVPWVEGMGKRVEGHSETP